MVVGESKSDWCKCGSQQSLCLAHEQKSLLPFYWGSILSFESLGQRFYLYDILLLLRAYSHKSSAGATTELFVYFFPTTELHSVSPWNLMGKLWLYRFTSTAKIHMYMDLDTQTLSPSPCTHSCAHVKRGTAAETAQPVRTHSISMVYLHTAKRWKKVNKQNWLLQ